MTHKDRKTRKMRGSRTHGYGCTQKHRGAGSRGGRGLAGSKKHKWMFVSKYMKGHFGRHGFKLPSKIIKKQKTINVGQIDERIESLVKNGKAKKEAGVYKLNLTELGYDKLLGSGKVIHKLIITAESCTKSALEKIEKFGGRVETGVPETSN